MLILSGPYYTWESSVGTLCIACLLFLFIFNRQSIISDNNILLCLLLLILLLYAYGIYDLHLYFYAPLLVFLFLLDEKKKCDFWETYTKIYAYIILVSFIIYLLVVFVSFPLHYDVIDPIAKTKNYGYRAYPFLLISMTSEPIANLRFHGVFDEPGVVGTISAIILLVEKFNLKKWTNIVLLVSGLFTFSFFFVSISIFFLFLNCRIKYIILIIGVFLFFYQFTKDDPALNQLIYSRFEFDQQRGIAANNRSSVVFDYNYSSFLHSNDVFLGRGDGSVAEISNGISTYKAVIYERGIIYFTLAIVFFLLNALLKIKDKKNFILYCLLLLSSIYQRPDFFSPIFFFLYITSVSKLAVIRH